MKSELNGYSASAKTISSNKDERKREARFYTLGSRTAERGELEQGMSGNGLSGNGMSMPESKSVRAVTAVAIFQ
jgi:hypothetical protein